jgi:small subunit ribosomal protein S20
MANTLGSKKAIRVSERKRVFNDRRRKAMRKIIKEITELVKAKKIDEAKKKLPEAYKAIDKAQKRGIIKKNTASRKKASMSRMTKA